MGIDYYSALGLPKSSPDADIKKAFRKLATRYHPAKNVENKEFAEKKFKEVAEAYEVLSEPQKRAVYDQYGEDGLKKGAGAFNPKSADEIFEQFFGSHNPFADTFGDEGGFGMGSGGFSHSSGPQKAPPVIKPIAVGLEELYTGTTKKIKVSQQALNADGKTTKKVEKIIAVDIKRGWKRGTKLTFQNAGDEIPGTIPADLIVTIEEKPHPYFKREGDQLIFTATVPLEQALTGCVVTVTTLDGRVLKLPVNEIVKPGYVKVVAGEGMPNSKTGHNGDLHVHFNIEFPAHLTQYQKQLIKQAFSATSS